MEFINEKGTLPVPFNLIPTPKMICFSLNWVKNTLTSKCETKLNSIEEEMSTVVHIVIFA